MTADERRKRKREYNLRYSAAHRAENCAREKRRRLAMTDEELAHCQAIWRRWCAEHPEQRQETVRRCNARVHRWPVGLPVWYYLRPWWLEGEIVAKYGRGDVVVRLKGGTEIRTSARTLRREEPPGAR